MSNQGELHRILSNPDNLIVSDSIRDRVDFLEDDSPEISSVLTFESFDVFGKFVNYEYSSFEEKSCCSVSLVCPEGNLSNLLSVEINEICNLKVQKFEITGAVLGISVSDSNSELLVNVVIERNT